MRVHSFHVLPFLLGPVLSAKVYYDRTTSVGPNGPEFSGIPVDVYNPLPTLIYNCYNLKSICKNVEEYLTDNGLAMGNGLEFHYDSDQGANKARRDDACPGNWRKNMPVDCGLDPAQPSVMPGNLPARVGPLATWPNPFFNIEIPNLLGNAESGMRYTCDEFPAASWIEGGMNNNPPYTSMYCAPKSVSCDGVNWVKARAWKPTYLNTFSEQDWQGKAHGLLGDYGKARHPNAPIVMKFRFTTTTLPAASVATAAQVIMPAYANVPAATGVTNTKRDEGEDIWTEGVHCTGAFCAELSRAGFVFDEPSPTPSFQVLKAGAGTESEAESPHATFHVLAF